MATDYISLKLGRPVDYEFAKQAIGPCKVLDTPITVKWILADDGAKYIFHIKYYNRRGVCFCNEHKFGETGLSKFRYTTLSTDNTIKSLDESKVWSAEIANYKGINFFDGFVSFMDDLANGVDEYVDLDDIVM